MSAWDKCIFQVSIGKNALRDSTRKRKEICEEKGLKGKKDLEHHQTELYVYVYQFLTSNSNFKTTSKI